MDVSNMIYDKVMKARNKTPDDITTDQSNMLFERCEDLDSDLDDEIKRLIKESKEIFAEE